tara:strand:- start:279 stop:671 length:393 start_codon:yes stop_codon:yes gene_type:complete
MSKNWRSKGLELKGSYKCLGNSHLSSIIVEGITYPSVEHAFHASKVSDRSVKFRISKASLAEVRNLLEDIWIRPNWNDVKYATLHQLVKLKFESNKELAKVLTGTGTQLLGGKHDAELGSILMKVRSEIA